MKLIILKRPDAIRPESSNKLSKDKEQRILGIGIEPDNANLQPSQIVLLLAGQGGSSYPEKHRYRETLWSVGTREKSHFVFTEKVT
ncbi:hypothetical protein [Endozoicomonas sp. 4G]|uniref:hypothetical protein n=1 Tax=Endozoicomonas sp. 4G TaxID=2872754 RepID=UPI002078DA14|nr:hypothetical protein [Endozoicomonas sp. 4G]